MDEWVTAAPITLDGKPFSFVQREYLKEPYSEAAIWHPYQVDMKSTQMCLTSRAMLKCLFGARYRGWRGILYLFPTAKDVYDFSDTRIRPLIRDNPETVGSWMKDTSSDSKGLKQIWNAFLYLRGMGSLMGLKGIPVDFLVLDEEDEAPQKNIHAAEKRMADSEFKEQMRLSNPSLPDFGIAAEFDRTDQRYWIIKCRSCGKQHDLIGLFPLSRGDDIPFFREVDGVMERVCVKCGAVLDLANGEWVAKHPRVTERIGRQYSQLWSQRITAQEIMDEYRDPLVSNTSFYNLTIGTPYVEAENRLSVEEVLALCGNEGMASSDHGPCFLGVDQGKDLHVVIGKMHPQCDGQIIHLDVHKDWEALDPLMERFHISRGVIDAEPETRNARAFAGRHPGKIFLNFSRDRRKGTHIWNERDMTVACDRTEGLDFSHNQIMNRRIVLPRENDLVKEFAQHCHNIAKKLEEMKESDIVSKRYVYVRLGTSRPDHFRHAFNLECMARQYGMAGFFGGSDLT